MSLAREQTKGARGKVLVRLGNLVIRRTVSHRFEAFNDAPPNEMEG